MEDPQLLSYLQRSQMPLEVCVTSNVRTKVCASVKTHPIRQLYKNGLKVTVNSDDPTMFNTSITQEYLQLIEKLNFSQDDVKQLMFNGIEASFMHEQTKEKTKHQFRLEWDKLLETYNNS